MDKWTEQKKEIQMLTKYMKKCSTSLPIKEMQIKMTLRFHITPVRMAIINNTKNKSAPIHCWLESKLVQPLWKEIWRLIRKWKTDLTYDPMIPLLSIYLKDCMHRYNKATCISLLISALFTIARLWKQLRCTTTDEWVKKMWYIYLMKH
jgi:hypothetical protein